ncbi:TPA: XRE family transcriptional regulator [Candidatus Gastranaerophilales bacterium HUM_3]|mgnify:FL=1|jgi:immunity repressor protein|nr:helix-turn-helix transcriptional regulator [bacterium]MBS5804341.1 helix-turn-helix transcriptional regulator [Acinetobacter sp.]CCZ50921.1 xRE family transcriptional regulator [Acinetobacter sp. CAG:196]DAA86083.1 MAG TPA: XRE family transcriptional regulator [Candidatus Gastranaerophilales bacterium HUM_3]DAA87994.1 MAG TPA: XRE family transcriptional regulator [Candidatus Gastranaerophilales bacterium HUM_4]DAA92340.1 MAG TPA: XRE family transcriptional regulator [Candidatus Gastranaerop
MEINLAIQENINVMSEKIRLKNLGINIKSERLRKNLSQERLAELTNISRNSVSLIETGKINPTILKVIDIARVLDVDVNILIKEV